MSRGAGRLAGAASGTNKIVGYGLSMLVLAIASLAIIPVMIAADGAEAWASIAVGQSIGGVAAVAIGYGWGLTGPAVIARASDAERLRAYAESLWTKCILYWPFIGAAVLFALLVAPSGKEFAIVGALSTGTVGLTAGWYFVGLSRPYAMFVLETVPRVLGTVAGIVLMLLGSGALVGVLCQLMGMLAGFVVSSIWIYRSSGIRADDRLRRRPIPAVLRSQGMGMSSMLMSSGYIAAPIVIVSAVAPAALPVYAIVDKVQRQVSVALNPFVTVFQGWVPRAEGRRLRTRVAATLATSAVAMAAFGVVMYFGAPFFIHWLGGAQIRPSLVTLVLMSALLAVNIFESVVSKAIMVAIERVPVVATATLVGSVVGLPLVVFGAIFFGASGALAGILTGLLVRLGIQLISIARFFLGSAESAVAPREEESQHEYL